MPSFIGEKTPSKIAGLTYTVSACAFFFVSLLIGAFASGVDLENPPEWYLYASFLAAPVGFLLSAFWYFFYTRTPIKVFAKAQLCHPKYYFVALILQIGLLSLGELNTLFLRFLGAFGYESAEIILPSMDGGKFVGVFVSIAVLPPIMEELFFRCVFLREMKDFSTLGQMLLCGGLFALYHQNPAQTPYQFICGACFALVAIKAGSFFPTVLSHFVNNALIVVLYKLGITSYGVPMYVIMLIISALCLAGSLLYLLKFDKQKENEKKEKKEGSYKQFFLYAGVGIFVFALSWIATLSMGL